MMEFHKPLSFTSQINIHSYLVKMKNLLYFLLLLFTLSTHAQSRQTSDWEGTLWGKPDWADRPGGKSEEWVRQSLTPTTANPGYGYMNWFLNTDRKLLPSAPASAFVHIGNGTNFIYVDPEHDLVAVVRWIENAAMDGMVKRIPAAVH